MSFTFLLVSGRSMQRRNCKKDIPFGSQPGGHGIAFRPLAAAGRPFPTARICSQLQNAPLGCGDKADPRESSPDFWPKWPVRDGLLFAAHWHRAASQAHEGHCRELPLADLVRLSERIALEIAMLKRTLIAAGLVSILNCLAPTALAADNAGTAKKTQAEPREKVYGSQLMTRQERDEYRAKKRSAKTAEEHDRIRKEHNEKMKARAKELRDKERATK
jgi:hypothetical protein